MISNEMIALGSFHQKNALTISAICRTVKHFQKSHSEGTDQILKRKKYFFNEGL
jgi:hypothetical protein